VVTAGGLVVLTAALLFRLALFWPRVAADIRAPERVFGFFTIAAGIDVLGVRLAASHPVVTAVLAGVACVVWLVLTYGVPASLLLRRGRDSVLDGVNGTWLLWVVGTQSLAVAAAELEPAWPSQSELLSSASIALWSVVFPLGMYSVATLSYGKAARIGFMTPLSRFMLWVAVGSWVWSPPHSPPALSWRAAASPSATAGSHDDVLDLRHVAVGGGGRLLRGAPLLASVHVRGVPVPPVVRRGDRLERAVVDRGLVQELGQGRYIHSAAPSV
jgi:hypothetical protein